MCRSSLHEGNAQVCSTRNPPRLVTTELLFQDDGSSPCNDHDYETMSAKYMTNRDSNFSNPTSKSLSMICDMLVSNMRTTTTTDQEATFLTSPGHTKEQDTSLLVTTNRRKKKQVSIHKEVNIRLIIARQEISPEEYNATWYSQEEYAKITESCCKQITMLNRGELLKDKKYCSRGLESHTKTRSRVKSMARSLACQIVLQEQDRQWREGIRHEDALAYLYHSASSSCQLWANVIGLEDQKEAAITYDDSDHEESLVLSP